MNKHTTYILLRVLIILISLLNLVSCKKNDYSRIGEYEEVIIKGELSDFNKNDISVSIRYRDLITKDEICHITKTDKHGKFQLQFLKYNVQDVYLNIDDYTIPLLVIPGEGIQLRLSLNNDDESIKFKGEHAKLQKQFTELYSELVNIITSSDSTKEMVKTFTPEEYKTYVLENEIQYVAFLNKYADSIHVNEIITSWFETYIKYNSANKLLSPYLSPTKNKKYGLTTDYWEFFNKYPISNERALFCTEYYKFCTSYFIFLNNIKGTHTMLYKDYGNDWKRFYSCSIDTISNIINGTLSDILISNIASDFMKDDKDSFEETKENIYKKINNEKIRNHLPAKYNSLKDKIDSIQVSEDIRIYDYRSDTSNTDIVSLLQSKYKGKIIYVDNWASWCGPCINEMPYSINLQNLFIDKDIVFVFLCGTDNFKNDRAIAIISDLHITGEHYLLSFRQSIFLQKNYGIKGIPHYLIINNEGEIVDMNAPRPSSSMIKEKLIELIDEV